MGNGVGRESREVTLSLHSVHNVEHGPNESYFGMATDHRIEADLPVTSERPARFVVDLDTVLSVRIFLHTRGAAPVNDRVVGQLSIPIREVLESCGPGIYQMWFLLQSAAPYDVSNYEGLSERFRNSMHAAPSDLHVSRICLSVLEAPVQPAMWGRSESERERATYYTPVYVSHMQHLQLTRAYFDHLDRCCDLDGDARTLGGWTAPKAPVDAPDLRNDFEWMQRQQREDAVDALRQELDEVTEEANRRIESGNQAIIELKAELKHVRDVEAPAALAERSAAEARLEAARRRSDELRQAAGAARTLSGAAGVELDRLREELLVLTNQKSALLKLVQDVYGGARGASAQGARAREAGAGIGGGGGGVALARCGRQSDDMPVDPELRLLPDPRELLGTAAPLPQL